MFFDALKSQGLGRILAEPNLVTTSGQEASFLAGGEFPIPVPQQFQTITIEYKKFGVGLNFTPTVLDNDMIAMKVNRRFRSWTSPRGWPSARRALWCRASGCGYCHPRGGQRRADLRPGGVVVRQPPQPGQQSSRCWGPSRFWGPCSAPVNSKSRRRSWWCW
jgi:hypothetical protein